jgi:ribonuclease HI
MSLFFDGCSKGNPGPAGAGYVIYQDNHEIFSESKYLGKQTNNVAEYSALIIGLEKAIELNLEELEVYGDSMLVIKQLQGLYKIKSPTLKPFYEKAFELSKKLKIKFHHILRAKNKRADELANEALIY